MSAVFHDYHGLQDGESVDFGIGRILAHVFNGPTRRLQQFVADANLANWIEEPALLNAASGAEPQPAPDAHLSLQVIRNAFAAKMASEGKTPQEQLQWLDSWCEASHGLGGAEGGRSGNGIERTCPPSAGEWAKMQELESCNFALSEKRHAHAAAFKSLHRSSDGSQPPPGRVRLMLEAAVQPCTTILAAVIIGIVIFLMHEAFTAISEARLRVVLSFLDDGQVFLAWLAMVGCMSISLLAVVATVEQPPAASSGIPGIIGFLNGVRIPRLFTPKVWLVKVFGTILSVGSGLIIGPEGPAVHIGAMTAVQVIHRWKKRLPCFHCDLIKVLQTDINERDLVAIGAGCGIAAAFKAPLSGTLFVIEEASSSFSLPLLWRAFTACIASYWTMNIAEELTTGHKHLVFDNDRYKQGCPSYTYRDLPWFCLIGATGGLMGCLFNALNHRLNRWRLTWPKRANGKPAFTPRLIEAVIIILTTSTVLVLVPSLVPSSVVCKSNAAVMIDTFNQTKAVFGQDMRDRCSDPALSHAKFVPATVCVKRPGTSTGTVAGEPVCSETKLEMAQWHLPLQGTAHYGCGKGPDDTIDDDLLSQNRDGLSLLLPGQAGQDKGPRSGGVPTDPQPGDVPVNVPAFNQLASLFLSTGPQSVTNLFRSGAFDLWDTLPLLLYLIPYFFLAVVTSGMALPSGLMLPFITIGAAMGRIYGNVYVQLYREIYPAGSQAAAHGGKLHCTAAHGCEGAPAEFLFDPAVWAIAGSAAMLVGSGRITLTLTIILLETSNDIHMLPPLAIAAIVAQYCGPKTGLYHMLMQLQGVPYLDTEPTDEQGVAKIGSIMNKDVIFFQMETTVAHIKTVLWDSDHNGFPVVNEDGTYAGLVLRMQLQSLVDFSDASFSAGVDGGAGVGQQLPSPYQPLRQYVKGLQKHQQLNAQLDFRESNVHLEDGSTDLKEVKRKEKARLLRDTMINRRRNNTGGSTTSDNTVVQNGGDVSPLTTPRFSQAVPVPTAADSNAELLLPGGGGGGSSSGGSSSRNNNNKSSHPNYGSSAAASASTSASAATASILRSASISGLQYKRDSYSMHQDDYSWVDGTDSVLLSLDQTIDSDVVSINEDFTAAEGFRIFRQLGLRHLAVCDSGGKLVGIVTRKDLLPWRCSKLSQAAYAFKWRDEAEITYSPI